MFTSSSATLWEQSSVCPVCGSQSLEAPPTSAGSQSLESLARSDAAVEARPSGSPDTTIDLTWPPPDYWHPLLRAVWNDDIQHVRRLLGEASGLRQINDGPGNGDDRSPLWHAVQYRRAEICKLLLQARADPHKRISRPSRRPDRPWICSTPYSQAEGHIRDIFDEVLWPNGPPPPPPPPASTPIQLRTGVLYL